MIVALIVTICVEVPIDRQIEQWTVATLPSNWQALSDRWEFYHAIRTFVSIGALGLATTSSLIDRPDRDIEFLKFAIVHSKNVISSAVVQSWSAKAFSDTRRKFTGSARITGHPSITDE